VTNLKLLAYILSQCMNCLYNKGEIVPVFKETPRCYDVLERKHNPTHS